MLLESVLRQRFRWVNEDTLSRKEGLGELVALVDPVAVSVDQDVLAEVQVPGGDVRLRAGPRRGSR